MLVSSSCVPLEAMLLPQLSPLGCTYGFVDCCAPDSETGKLQFHAVDLFTHGIIGMVISVCAFDALLNVETIKSADALGTGVAWPLPPMKYQSKPALLESTCQL